MDVNEAKQEAVAYLKRGENCNFHADINQKSLVYDFLNELYQRGFKLIGPEEKHWASDVPGL